MIFDDLDAQDLLRVMSIIRRILTARGIIDHDPVKSVQRCAEEMTEHAAQQDIPQEPAPLEEYPSQENNDAEPSAVDQADGTA